MRLSQSVFFIAGAAGTPDFTRADATDDNPLLASGNSTVVCRYRNAMFRTPDITADRRLTISAHDNGQRGRDDVRSASDKPHPRSEEHTSELQSLRHLVCR